MSLLRKSLVVVLAVVLVLTAVSANGAVAAERTVLDGDFVKDSLESEDAYAVFRETAIETIDEQGAETGGEVGSELRTTAVERAVTGEYIRTQAEANIDRTYAYLHGDTDSLELFVETEPVIERLGPAIEELVTERTVGELLEATGVDLEFQELPVDTALLTQLEEGPEGYEAARSEVRSTVEQRIVDELVQETYASLSNDERLALVIEDYDPTAYTEAEKEQMVEDRRSEIEAAIEDRLRSERGDEIDQQVTDTLNQIADQAEADAPSDPQTVEEAAAGVQAVLVRGLADQDLTYETFHQDLAQAKRTLGEIMGQTVQEEARSELGDRISLTEQMDESAREQLETAQSAVGIVDIVSILLPLLVLVLVGLLWLVSRSPFVVSLATGVSLFLAGALSWLGAEMAGARLQDAITPSGGESPEAIVELLSAIVRGVINTFVTQSMVILVLGGALVVLAVLLWYEVVTWPSMDELRGTE